MRKRSEYKFGKNAGYALSGLGEIFANEKSFKIELCIVLVLVTISLFLSVGVSEHILLVLSLGLVLLTECINSAIERAVDLVSGDISQLAKFAKDAGSAAVFVAIMIAAFTWLVVLLELICA